MQRLAWTAIAAVLLLTWNGAVVADDGVLFRKNVSKTPDEETHHASIKMLPLYVPAQNSDFGTFVIEYETPLTDEGFETTREYARPLIAIYEDGPVDYPEDCGGFYGHGERDLYAAVSLDDGATWKRSNLSRSASRSSIRIDRKPYPGDVFRNFVASARNHVLAVWASRYCESGGPSYSLDDFEIEELFASDLVDFGDLTAEACTDDDPVTPCLYFEDYWHVAGSQGIADMADEDYPTVGEVPYACLWAARGTLEPFTDNSGLVTYAMVWRQAERLTSGVRDVHRMEASCVADAGCVVTWQEDPDGLRPGKGEGPGEGWSGAIAHHETDIWYAYIDWDHFGLVDDGGIVVPFSEYTSDKAPKAAVPFSMPVRLTDNAMCTGPDALGNEDDPFCTADFDGSGTADFCESTVAYEIVTPVGTSTLPMCVTEDGRLMRGNTAATRARTHLHGYDSDGDGVTDRAWVVLAYEESKGLGDEEELSEADKVDMGKNIWYHTFDMFEPELVSQGLQLNQPAVYPPDSVDLDGLTGYTLTDIPVDDGSGNFFVTVSPDPIYEGAGLETELYQSEIARRFSLISQDASKAIDTVGGTVAFAMFKQGIVRQGGPADIFARRFVLPLDFDATTDNPYDYANMACDQWATFSVDPNPRYVKGLCLSPAINLSGTTVLTCEDNTVGTCDYTAFPFDDMFADLAGTEGEGVPSVYNWRQCDEASSVDGCSDGLDDTLDTSWANPFDMAKGHRGFIKGDFLMVMYVWTPNWSANTAGHENANLYVRRSFDGGLTWTTTPAGFAMTLPDGVTVTADGTTHCEWYFDDTGSDEVPLCFDYAAGAFEQARNVSQLIGTHLTVLDPRFTPTPGSIVDPDDTVDDGFFYDLYDDDVTDPSKFFATFETGDTEGVAEGGEAIPMDLFYARATNYGDDYDLALEDGDALTLPDACAADDPDCEFSVFDWLENKRDDHASEAAVTTNPGGTMFYAVWNQWQEDDHEVAFDSDAIFRRTLELGDLVGTLPSGGGGSIPNVPDPPGNRPNK